MPLAFAMPQVEGIPSSCKEKDVREFFKVCGEIVKVDMPLDDTGAHKGSAEVIFKEADVLRAVAMDGEKLRKQSISVKVRTRGTLLCRSGSGRRWGRGGCTDDVACLSHKIIDFAFLKSPDRARRATAGPCSQSPSPKRWDVLPSSHKE